MKAPFEIDEFYENYKNDCKAEMTDIDLFLKSNTEIEDGDDKESIISNVNSVISKMMDQREVLVQECYQKTKGQILA